MGLFFLGLLAGIALGMWCAILLYQYSGKAQHGWPLRRKQAKKTESAEVAANQGADDRRQQDDRRPVDDFTDEYYAEQEKLASQTSRSGTMAGPTTSLGPEAHTPAGQSSSAAAATVVYTGAGGETDSASHGQPGTDTADEHGVHSPGAATTKALPNPEQAVAQPDAYASLLEWVDGDVEAAEALIEAEHERTPAVSRSRLIENALLRLQYSQH